MRNSTILFLVIVAFSFGCNLNDNFSEEPMFLQINSIDLITGPEQGEDTHAILDVWVFVDGFNVGVFQVLPDRPARVPIISDNPTFTVDFFGGIRNNGISQTPKQYPFFERVQTEIDFLPNEVVEMDLEFQYKDDIVFPILEDFEFGQIYSEDIDVDQDNSIIITEEPEDVVFGTRAAKYTVGPDELTDFVQATTVFETEMFGASEVYLEIDFNSEIPFFLGYIGFDEINTFTTDFTILLRPTEGEWTKLYLDLSSHLNGGLFERFQLLVAGAPDTGSGCILIDNVKLVHQAN